MEPEKTIKHASERERQQGNITKKLKEERKEIEDITISLTTSEPDSEVAKLDSTEQEGGLSTLKMNRYHTKLSSQEKGEYNHRVLEGSTIKEQSPELNFIRCYNKSKRSKIAQQNDASENKS